MAIYLRGGGRRNHGLHIDTGSRGIHWGHRLAAGTRGWTQVLQGTSQQAAQGRTGRRLRTERKLILFRRTILQ